MSYCRWSTRLPIKSTCDTCGREPAPLFDMTTDKGREEWTKYYMNREIGFVDNPDGYEGKSLCPDCICDWYIFWSCYSNKLKSGQVLAVWTVGHICDYTFPEIEDIIKNNDWNSIQGYNEVGDPYDMMKNSLRSWVKEVEKEFK